MGLAIVVLSGLALASCGGERPAPVAPTPAPTTLAEEEARDVCMEDRGRRGECIAAYVPAWVGWAVEIDEPIGIAADDAKLGRPALVAKWMEFWKRDTSTDDWAMLECKEQLYEMDWPAIAEKERACLALPACDAFVGCIEPLERAALAADHETGTAGAD